MEEECRGKIRGTKGTNDEMRKKRKIAKEKMEIGEEKKVEKENKKGIERGRERKREKKHT